MSVVIESLQNVRKLSGLPPLQPAEVEKIDAEVETRELAEYRRDLKVAWRRSWDRHHGRVIAASRGPTIDLSVIETQRQLDAALASKKGELLELTAGLIRLVRLSMAGTKRSSWEGPVRKAFEDWASKNLPADVANAFESQRLDAEVANVLDAIFPPAVSQPTEPAVDPTSPVTTTL